MRHCNVCWTAKRLATSMIIGCFIIYLTKKTGILPKNEIIKQPWTEVSETVAPNPKYFQTKQAGHIQIITHTDPNQALDTSTVKTDTELGMFNVILTFRITNDTVGGDARMQEYMWTLSQFLENRLVKHVHLMVESQEEISDYFQKSSQRNIQKDIQNNFQNNTQENTHNSIQKNESSHPELIPNESQRMHSGYYQKISQNGITHQKLTIQQVNSPDEVLTLHQFAFNHFQGEVVVITQADIILGEGFEVVNRTLLAGNRLLYSLSRHESKCGSRKDQCDDYSGSHDTFVFVPEGNLTQNAKDLLNHTIFSYGTENLVMYVYQHLLKYRILNPCKILRTYHYHCTNFRKYKKPRKWVNVLFDERSRAVDRLL